MEALLAFTTHSSQVRYLRKKIGPFFEVKFHLSEQRVKKMTSLYFTAVFKVLNHGDLGSFVQT